MGTPLRQLIPMDLVFSNTLVKAFIAIVRILISNPAVSIRGRTTVPVIDVIKPFLLGHYETILQHSPEYEIIEDVPGLV